METRDSLIQVTDLKKHYHMGAIRALDGVTVDIYRGDVMVVIGPSGSGKSTFLRSLNLLEEPTGGAIVFDGVDITKKKYRDAQGNMVKLDIDKLRQKMGMVFQHFNRKSRGRGKSFGSFRSGGTEGSSRRLPDSAFRRAEAACGYCARTCHGAGGYVV